jgi:hypothetical protein
MARTLDWSYEVAPAGADAAGLEEYVVETAGGDGLGKVHVVLSRGDDLFVVLERGLSPLRRELVAIPTEDVESVDHARLRVRLRARTHADLRALPRLDPGAAVEGDRSAEARRVHDLPPSLAPLTVPGDAPRVADTAAVPLAIGTGIASAFALLLVVLVATAGGAWWQWLLLGGATLLALAAGGLAYRAWRRPRAKR